MSPVEFMHWRNCCDSSEHIGACGIICPCGAAWAGGAACWELPPPNMYEPTAWPAREPAIDEPMMPIIPEQPRPEH